MDAHPLCALIPEMSAQDFARLRDDIEAHGLHRPIVTLDGTVLDGRHRLRACQEVGVPPRFEEFTGADPADYVYSENVSRRHLSKSQLAIVAVRLKAHYAVEAKARQSAAGGDRTSAKALQANLPEALRDTGQAREKAASRVGVSARMVDQAEHVMSKGVPALISAVEAGSIAVSEAEAISKLSKTRQEQIVALDSKRARHALVQRSDKAMQSHLKRGPVRPPVGSELPGTELVRSLLTRLELITNDIQSRGLSPEQFVGCFMRELDWDDPILTARVAHVSETIRALGSLAFAADKARRAA